MIHRRQFLAGLAAVPALTQDTPDWGGPVLDFHLHPKQGADGEAAHMKGCGVTRAVLLTRDSGEAKSHQLAADQPDKFVYFIGTDTAKPGAVDVLRAAAKNGARGFGELKSHVAADGPEMKRVYDLAAELGVPVLMHFQVVEHFAAEGTFNIHIESLPAILKAHPKTTFIGHADLWWANISAEVPADVAYPKGPVKKGGLTDRLLADFPNMYGDCSANSGRNGLGRDPEFTAGFLARHQNKLIFGSDCSCRDGRGAGQGSQEPLIKGKCVARETLAVLKKQASPEVFRKITWVNGNKLLKLKV
ncbi:MAG: amidohydrolase [Bryobacteraceae bacterium]